MSCGVFISRVVIKRGKLGNETGDVAFKVYTALMTSIFLLKGLSHLPDLVHSFKLFSFIQTKITGVKPPPDHSLDQTTEPLSDVKRWFWSRSNCLDFKTNYRMFRSGKRKNDPQ